MRLRENLKITKASKPPNSESNGKAVKNGHISHAEAQRGRERRVYISHAEAQRGRERRVWDDCCRYWEIRSLGKREKDENRQREGPWSSLVARPKRNNPKNCH